MYMYIYIYHILFISYLYLFVYFIVFLLFFTDHCSASQNLIIQKEYICCEMLEMLVC